MYTHAFSGLVQYAHPEGLRRALVYPPWVVVGRVSRRLFWVRKTEVEFDWVKLLEVGRNLENGLLSSKDGDYTGCIIRCPPGVVDLDNLGRHQAGVIGILWEE